jgi:hypothetical protein
MNARRFMSDIGFLPRRPTSCHQRTRRRPTQPVYRMLSLPRNDRHVLGADLHKSVSKHSWTDGGMRGRARDRLAWPRPLSRPARFDMTSKPQENWQRTEHCDEITGG